MLLELLTFGTVSNVPYVGESSNNEWTVRYKVKSLPLEDLSRADLVEPTRDFSNVPMK